MTKEEAIRKINNTPSIYLNTDQKRIAIGIIESVPKGQDILNYFDFIMKRADVGFKYDVAPEIAIGRIAVVNEMKDLNINTTDDVDIDENKLIIGDNYEALKNLLLTHKEKIDVIYIDPPYNTEKAKEDGNTSAKEGQSSKFIYKDKFGRNGWLNMMRERLILAKRLLSPEGVIFVSIDDTEQAYLKVLMDDIFGEDHFVNQFNWLNNKTGRQLSNFGAAKTYEYILCYAKEKYNVKKFIFIDREFLEKELPTMYLKTKKDILKDQISNFIIEHELYQRNRKINEETSPTLCFDIFWDKNKNKFYPVDINERPDKYKEFQLFECKKNNDGIHKYQAWRWGREKILTEGETELIVKKTKSGEERIYSKKRNFQGTLFKDTITDITTQNGTNELLDLGLNFDMPKSTLLLKLFISLFSNKVTVLDFFSGSGTMGHTIMELNREDNGNRKFILVTNNENNIALDTTYERLHRIIKGEGTKKEKDFKWLEKNKTFNDVKLRVFNIKHFDVETDQSNKLKEITNFAINNLKKISPHYNDNDKIQVYYDLDGLNPLNEAQTKQIYSTDSLIHEESKVMRGENKVFCTCGKSFLKSNELVKHIKEQNAINKSSK